MKKIFFIFILSLSLSSCEKAGERQYTEIILDEAPAAVLQQQNTGDPHAGLDLGNMGNSDPHSGFSKDQLQNMLLEQGLQIEGHEKAPGFGWTAPEGWEEKPAGGMRLASFVSKDDPASIDCSIVTLGAGAGGLEANIVRWLGQIHITLPEDQIKNFINKQDKLRTAGAGEALMLDFTQLQKNSVEPSMIAAIIDTPDQRIFVKMTGSRAEMLKNLKPFQSLVKSIRFLQ